MNYGVNEYIRDYFRNKFPEYYLLEVNGKSMASGDGIFEIIHGILKNELSNKNLETEYDRMLFANSNLDSILYSAIDSRLNGYFKEAERRKCKNLFNYVYSDRFIAKYEDKVTDSVLRNMAGQIMAILYRKHDTGFIDSKFDNTIEAHYQNLYHILCSKVRKCIESVIIDEIEISDFLQSGINSQDMIDVTLDFVMQTIPYGSIESLDAENKTSLKIRGEIKRFLEKYIANYKKESIKPKSKPTSLQYIRGYLEALYKDTFSADDLERCASFVNSRLVGQLKMNPADIVNKKLNDHIDANVEVYIRSCKLDKVPVNEKLEYDPKPKKVAKPIVSLLLAGAIFTLTTAQTLGFAVEMSEKRANENLSRLLEADGFTKPISSMYDYQNSSLPEKILTTYCDKYEQYGEDKFYGISFAEAYMNIQMDNKLVLMEDLFREVKALSIMDSSHFNFAVQLTGKSCFLDYMYSSLEKMGFSEIKEEKYQALLEAYKQDRMNHPDDNNYQLRLSPEQLELLQEVEDKYVELYKKLLVEAEKISKKENNTVGRGGKI